MPGGGRRPVGGGRAGGAPADREATACVRPVGRLARRLLAVRQVEHSRGCRNHANSRLTVAWHETCLVARMGERMPNLAHGRSIQAGQIERLYNE